MLLPLVLLQAKKFKEGLPPKAIRCNKLFTVEADLNEIMCDDSEAYMNTKSIKSYFHVMFQSETTLLARYAHFNGKS